MEETVSTAADLRIALLRANPLLSRFDPLPRILAFDDFAAGLGGWCQLIGNHRGGDLDTVPASKRDLRPPQLSNLSFFDIGTHGAMQGGYALKLATRPAPRSTAVAIKRLTAARPGRVRFELYFTFKAEASFDDATGDGNADPSEARFGDFTISNDVKLPGAKRFLLTLRYVNTDAAGNFVQKWMCNTSVHPTTKMQLTGEAADDAGFDLHAMHPDDWIEVPGGHQMLCYNEVPTKINWHYLCWTFDTGEQRNIELRVNDRVMDLRDLPVPFYDHDYTGLDGLLNFLVDVRTHQPVRNFVWVDAALISVDW